MPQTVDILIAGGGIIGMSTAYQLARRSNLRIMVVDKGAGPGEGSTGASSAICRFRYTHDAMVELARDGIAAYRNWTDFLGTGDVRAKYHRHGALWFGGDGDAGLQSEAKRLERLGIGVELLGHAEVRERFPALNPCVVPPDLREGTAHDCRSGGTHLLESDAGYVDPVSALQDLIDAARREGVEVRFSSEVADVDYRGGRVVSARLASGETIHCGAFVAATGPWCNRLLSIFDLADRWPLEPTRIQIVHIDRPAAILGDIPICGDPSGGIYFRPQNRGQQILVGSVLAEDERERADPDKFATYIDDEFARRLLHALHHRLPALSYSAAVHGYSGLYTINRADVHPVVGATPIEGVYMANGCSGHGFKLAPAIGSLLAQSITGESRSFDTRVGRDFLAIDREPIALASKTVLA
ncbi:Glycine/D-amino acid oxidase [Sphingopyxis sp. YR583]|uniref:NAD(P)/FAD-dependent oxidoreductase n=1 Tax=Sphingopyxis sp. YR583 TaxID=1881047 RepID=UPI0008A7F6BC|nr:FAD-dependent oxidoreductase [Sphingopyxis sp. YR583]SEH13934.1 Glycine/D-amino acid oxidase [Sphingopyxis sp. YR583]